MSATRAQLDASLLQLLHQRVDACFVQAEARLGRSFPRPQIHCNMRGRAAGSARLQTWELRFNPALYEANQQAFLAEVVPHEVAHLLVYALWGEGRGKSRAPPHGRQWQSVMRELFALAPTLPTASISRCWPSAPMPMRAPASNISSRCVVTTRWCAARPAITAAAVASPWCCSQARQRIESTRVAPLC